MTIFVFLALCSCKKQNEIETLPLDKLYILEYYYTVPEDYEYPRLNFYVASFCELDKDFNFKYARKVGYDIYEYHDSESIPDSVRNIISDILSKYQTDTTFLYQGPPGSRIYDGNAYRFIMQKHNQKDITIKFEPQYLPEDLMLIYSYLCENQGTILYEDKFSRLLEMFENQTKSEKDELELKHFPPLP